MIVSFFVFCTQILRIDTDYLKNRDFYHRMHEKYGIGILGIEECRVFGF